ncbi:MAG: hypothetical protein ACRYGO_05590 [Janthinobacterium lividum]
MTRKYWFAAKPPGRGWGWSAPLTWQGRLVYVAFFLLMIGGGFLIAPHGVQYYVAFVCVLAILLMLAAAYKGEPPGRFPSGER